MHYYRLLVAVLVLTVVLYQSTTEGVAHPGHGRKTAHPTRAPTNTGREPYVRISREGVDDFCIGRPEGNALYCASHESIPHRCSNQNINFTQKLVVLQGPDGRCTGSLDGVFNLEANFDHVKILRRLPILYDNMDGCPVSYQNGKWLEFADSPRDDVYRVPSPVPSVSASYQRNLLPWVKFNLLSQPNFLCVGRNGSLDVFCARNPRDRPSCAGSSFVNFDYRHVVEMRPIAPCTKELSGYYDMLVDVKSRDELDKLPIYDKDPGEPCVSYGFVDGAMEEMCFDDGRRCRP